MCVDSESLRTDALAELAGCCCSARGFERRAMTAEGKHEQGMFVLHLLRTQLCGLSFPRTPEHYSHFTLSLTS